MNNDVFNMDYQGVGELLHDRAIGDYVLSIAQEKANQLGQGYEAYLVNGNKRTIARVKAATKEARKDNLQNNTLLKALG